MLSPEDNRKLTATGRGTPVGELLRRYWQPIAAVLELEDRPIKPVRLFGEDLVLYRDQAGTYGLLDRRCPHRGADLTYGFVDASGLRCGYHGWRFDERGVCSERPYEDVVRLDSRSCERVGVTAYPVAVRAGILWAYLGPMPAPCLPDWARFHDEGRASITFVRVPCNWLQCQENSIDPVHFEWLHQNLPSALYGKGARAPRHVALEFEEFEHGFIYRRRLEGTDAEHPLWATGRVALWPQALYVGAFTWHVPVDDQNTLDVIWSLSGRGSRRSPDRVPYRYLTLERDAEGRYALKDIWHQDAVAMLGQGPIADRTRERLGESDRGVILFRRRLLAEAARVAEGQDPKGILREEARNVRLPLPRAPLSPEQRLGMSGAWGLSSLRERVRRTSLRAEGRARGAAAGLFRGLGAAKTALDRLEEPIRSVLVRRDLQQMLSGYKLPALIYLVVKLGVPDELAEGGKTARELAHTLGAHEGVLERVLQTLAAERVFTEESGKFFLNATSERLRSNVRGSLRGTALLVGEEYMPAFQGLLHTARTGGSAFEHVFSMSNWEHRRRHPDLNEAFNALMARGAEWCAPRLLAAYDFGRVGRVIDVGGGNGLLLAHLLRGHSALKGTLLDQAHVIEGARAVLARMGVEDRCTIVPGDFFSSVPAGGDVYVLKNILHDWDDGPATAILRACCRAMSDRARLLVLESPTPSGPNGSVSSSRRSAWFRHADLHMLAMAGGRERSEDEYAELFRASGLAMLRSIPISRDMRALEVRALPPNAI